MFCMKAVIETALQTHGALIELSKISPPLPDSCSQDIELQTHSGALVQLSTASPPRPASPTPASSRQGQNTPIAVNIFKHFY